jgi:hypothetical protein
MLARAVRAAGGRAVVRASGPAVLAARASARPALLPGFLVPAASVCGGCSSLQARTGARGAAPAVSVRCFTAAAPARGNAAPPPPPPKAAQAPAAQRPGEPVTPEHHDDLHRDIPHVSFLSSPIGWWKANNARLKVLFKRYGRLTLVTYLGVYVLTLSGLYALVRAGLVQGPDVNAFVNGWFVKRAVLGDTVVHIPAAWGDFATAWVLTKTTEPLRLVATLAAVPIIIRRAPVAVLRFLKAAAPAAAAEGAAGAASAAAKKM